MKEVYDLVEEIYEKLAEFFETTGQEPQAIALSPGSYRWLLELKSSDPGMINPFGYFRLVIDEILPDTEVRIEE